MKFLMHGIEIDTTKVKYKPALEDVLLMVTKTYYPDHYCPVKILDLEINRVDHHPLGR